jgi:hypothetical protein
MTQDEELNRALDRFDVPPPRGTLNAAIVEAAQSGAGSRWSPRSSMQRWVRRGGAMAAAVTLASAAAAAGWLGEPLRNLPVISSIATVMPDMVKAKAPLPKEQPKKSERLAQNQTPPPTAELVEPTPKAPEKAPPENMPQSVPEKPLASIDPKTLRQDARVETAAERIQSRLDARDTRRAEKGLAPNTAKERALLEAFKNAETPEARKAARIALVKHAEESKAKMQERMASWPLCTAEQAATPIKNKCRTPEMQAGEMQAGEMPLRQRLKKRAERNGEPVLPDEMVR